MSKSLKVAVWNANGLSQHRLEVESFLNSKNIDIMLVSETHFTKKSFINFRNYNIYHTVHPENKAHGGVCVIIKSKIKHYEAEKFQQTNIQATSVVVEDWSGPLTISAVYCPPRFANKESHYSQLFNTLNRRFFIGGDYNAKHSFWGSRLTNPKGRELMKSIKNMKLDILSTGEPTYWPADIRKIPDCIDFIVFKGMSKNYCSIESCFELSSDHSPIIATIQNKIVQREIPLTLCNNKTDWEAYKNYINSHLNLNLPLKTEDNINEAVENFNVCVQNAGWLSTPKSMQSNKLNTCSTEVLSIISLKRRTRKQWQLTRCPEIKRKLNILMKKLKRTLQKEKEQYIRSYLEKLSPSNSGEYSLWKATKKLKQPQQVNPPLRKNDNSWAKSNEEKASLFAVHLQNVFTPNPREISVVEEEEIHSLLAEPYQLELPLKNILVSEVKQVIIQEICCKKAPGYDLITGKILKELPEIGFKYLTYIFNAILRTSHFPAQWKVAQIIMVPKPGKPAEDVSSYRPISLLPLASKVFEKIFYKKIIKIIVNKSLIPNYQFGFRQYHSPIEQVHRITDAIHSNMENMKYSSVAFLDITQAFDKVWHTGLLYKLKKDLPQNMFTIIRSYIENRFFQVKIDNFITGLYTIHSGVPQGSILGPLLYLLFTRDLPSPQGSFIATFADDTAIMTSDVNAVKASELLQVNLNVTESWLKKWRIRVNSSKCKHVTFTTRRGNCAPVYLFSRQIPQADEVKYLGIHLDRRLTWQKHIFTKRKQLGLKLRNMYWLLDKTSALSVELKLLLYKSILKPVWTYGIQLWGTSANSNIEILQRFQSKLLRIILDAPRFVTNDTIHQDSQILTIKEEIRRYSIAYSRRISTHPNLLVEHLMDPKPYRRLQKKVPSDLV